MGTVHIIVNPTARHAWRWPARFEMPRHHAVVHHPESAAGARELVQAAAARGDLVVVAGGDGSCHNALQALPRQPLAAMGVIPLGTANDLGRDLDLPRETMAAAWRIADGSPHLVDVLTINGSRCLVGGGLGLPSRCIDSVHDLRSGSAWGQLLMRAAGDRVYQVAAPLHAWPTPQLLSVSISWTAPEGGHHHWDTEVVALFFLNQATIGGGLLLAPAARRNDGVFELSIIRPATSTKLITGLWRVSKSRPAPGQVVVIRTTAAQIELTSPTMVFADGEPLHTTRTVDIGILPGALQLIH